MNIESPAAFPTIVSVRLACSPAAPITVNEVGEAGIDVARNRIRERLRDVGARIMDETDKDMVAWFENATGAIASTRDIQRLVATELRDMGIYVRIGMVDAALAADGGSATTVDKSRQLARLATSSQTLACFGATDGLPMADSHVLSPVDPKEWRGEFCDDAAIIYAVAWQDDAVTRMAPAAAATDPVTRIERLRLRWRGEELILDMSSPRVTIGRGGDTEITIDSDFASRHHAHIEYLHACFVLTDHSTNGTHVRIDDSDTFIHNDGLVLRGQGWISLGRRPSSTAGKLLYFWGESATPDDSTPIEASV